MSISVGECQSLYNCYPPAGGWPMTNIISSENLKSLRKSRGWKQFELAKIAGVDKSVISRLERDLQNDVKASVIVNLANALGTSVDALLVKNETRDLVIMGELEGLIGDMAQLSLPHQKQIAAILKAYIETIPNDQIS